MPPASLPAFEDLSILCIGDVMLDRFVHGEVRRISPESPVPVVRLGVVESVPGGAANVGRNIAALGARCTLVGVIGADAAGDELTLLIAASGRVRPELVADPARPTSEKTRYVSQGQHLLRVDREGSDPIGTTVAEAVLDRIAGLIAGHDVVVLSDYAKGVLTPDLIRAVIDRASALGLPVVVDPKSSAVGRYAGATVLTPNAGEIHAATQIHPADDTAAEQAAAAMLALVKVGAVLLTRAERGMLLAEDGRPPVHVATAARDVFDVVGAGDTVVAVLALCLGAGLALEQAARVANAAAGIVVGKHGTATVSRAELVEALTHGGGAAAGKLLGWDDLAAQRERWRADGLRVGFTNGCFDLLHVGHVRLLDFAREQCDRLIVAVNGDASVRRLKGPSRPVNGEEDRAELIGALATVDAVALFHEDTPGELIARIVPDVLVKGSDYRIDQIVGGEVVLAAGGEVLTCPLVPDRSSSLTIARATDAAGAG